MALSARKRGASLVPGTNTHPAQEVARLQKLSFHVCPRYARIFFLVWLAFRAELVPVVVATLAGGEKPHADMQAHHRHSL